MADEEYRGPEQRKAILGERDLEKIRKAMGQPGFLVFGFKIQEVALIVTFIAGATLWFTGGQQAMVELRELRASFNEYVQNSDGYHAAAVGVSFRNGKPDGTFQGRRRSNAKTEEGNR